MSLASVRADLALRAPDLVVLQTTQRTATVAEAAQAHGVEHGRTPQRLEALTGGEWVAVSTAAAAGPSAAAG